MPSYPASARGYTLLELMAVIAILMIAAVVVQPNSNSKNNHAKLDAAGQELVNALRQAQMRSESSAVYTAVRVQEDTSIEVLEVDSTANPPEATTTPIIHPLSKRPYLITLSQRPATAGISFDTTDGPFLHVDSSTTEFLFFDPRGRPYVVGNTGIGLLAATNLNISLGKLRRKLDIDNISGRARIEDAL